MCSPSRDRTWPLARTRRGEAGPGGGLENGGNTRSRMHGKYSYGLSLDGRVIDIITRRSRMRRHRLSSSSRFPPVVTESLLSSRLSFRTSHGAPYIYMCVHIYTHIYNAPDLTNFFIYRLCRKISRPATTLRLAHFRLATFFIPKPLPSSVPSFLFRPLRCNLPPSKPRLHSSTVVAATVLPLALFFHLLYPLFLSFFPPFRFLFLRVDR